MLPLIQQVVGGWAQAKHNALSVKCTGASTPHARVFKLRILLCVLMQEGKGRSVNRFLMRNATVAIVKR